MKLRHAVLVPALILTAAAVALAAPGRYAISPVQIAKAVSSSGVLVSAAQVSPFAKVTADVPDPELQVKSIDRLGDGRVIARMACATADQCLPFLASLQIDTAPNIQVASYPPPPARRGPVQLTVRQGSRTPLYLDGPHVHITLTVICLESGSTGQTVRATSLDRHQTFLAQVAGDGTLRGRL